MRNAILKVFTASIVIPVFVCALPALAWPRVIVQDMVVQTDERVLLTAETKGRFFHKGGELVAFMVGGKSLGTTLSGGDGVAYKPFTPKNARQYRIEACSGDETGTGVLLALGHGSAIFLIDVEGVLLANPIFREPRSGSQKALERLREKLPIVYLQTGFAWHDATRRWLRNHGFPEAPVLNWEEEVLFHQLAARGIAIKALICGAGLVASAVGKADLVFCFDDIEGAQWVTDWQEIADRLTGNPRLIPTGNRPLEK